MASGTTTALPRSLESIVQSFQAVPDPMSRYKQLLHFATRLDTLSAEFHTPEHKVEGCVSQVWVAAQLDREANTLTWRADSDSQLTKGLAALLVVGLSGLSPQETVQISPDFITSLGFQQALTPSRNNGFLNMFRLMQRKALELCLQDGGKAGAEPSGAQDLASPGPDRPGSKGEAAPQPPAPSAEPSSAKEQRGPVAASMHRKLQNAFQPLRLELVDESSKHAHHAGVRSMGKAGQGGETHFALSIVSPRFEGLSTLKRHRLVYSTLADELAGSVHALQMNTQTPGEAGVH